MALGLLDIAPQTETVCGVAVKGVSSLGVVALLKEFPELKLLMNGKPMSGVSIMDKFPNAVAAIIAAGCGYAGTDKYDAAKEKAAELPLESQVEFLDSILRLTLPNGVGPFVERLEKLSGFVGEFGKGQVSS